MTSQTTSNDVAAARQLLTAEAAQRDLLLWDDYPTSMPTVEWKSAGVAGFLETAARLGLRVVYLWDVTKDEVLVGFIAGFALHGVLHEVVVGDISPLQGPSMTYMGQDFEPESFDSSKDAEPMAEPMSWTEREYQALEDEIRAIVDRVLEDPRYTGRSGGAASEVINSHAGQIDDQAYARVKEVAQRRYFELVETPLAARAERLAPEVIAQADFDPLDFRGDDAMRLVKRTFPDAEPRLVSILVRQVSSLIWERGLYESAQRALDGRAREVLERLPALERDRVCFAGRAEARAAILEPFVGEMRVAERLRVASAIPSAEYESERLTREARYAAAAGLMLKRGWAKSAAAQRLRISTSVIDRLLRDYISPRTLEPDDPIVTDLVPGLLQ